MQAEGGVPPGTPVGGVGQAVVVRMWEKRRDVVGVEPVTGGVVLELGEQPAQAAAVGGVEPGQDRLALRCGWSLREVLAWVLRWRAAPAGVTFAESWSWMPVACKAGAALTRIVATVPSPAPARCPLFSAATMAIVSTTAPRAILTSNPPGFIAARAGASIIPLVSAVRAQAMTSAIGLGQDIVQYIRRDDPVGERIGAR